VRTYSDKNAGKLKIAWFSIDFRRQLGYDSRNLY